MMSPADLLDPEKVKKIDNRFNVPTAEDIEEAKRALRESISRKIATKR